MNSLEISTRSAIMTVWSSYMATKLTTDEAKLAKVFADNRSQFVQEGLLPAMAAMRANEIEEAKRIVVEKFRPLYAPVNDGINALMQLQLDVAQKEYVEAEARYASIRLVSIGSIAMGVLFFVLFGIALIRSISHSLEQSSASAISMGDQAQRLVAAVKVFSE